MGGKDSLDAAAWAAAAAKQDRLYQFVDAFFRGQAKPGEDWSWCYVDEVAFEVDGLPVTVTEHE